MNVISGQAASRGQNLRRNYPLNRLRGISAKRQDLFAALGVEDQLDLLFFFPRTYDDWSECTPLEHIHEPGNYTFVATISSKPQLSRKGKLSWLRLRLTDKHYGLDATFFNQPWLQQKMRLGDTYVFHGKVDCKAGRRFVVNPSFLLPREAEKVGLLAVYPLRKGLTQKLIRQSVAQVLEGDLMRSLSDCLPDNLRRRYHLSTLSFALHNIHQAKNKHDLQLARYRLAFDELFLVLAALDLPLDEFAETKLSAPALQTTKTARTGLEQLRASLPFDLSFSQMQAINDVLRDLRKSQPMNRLLQGDVGSGKTMVAIFAMAYVALCGGQSMLMAPTSILAEQHFQTVKQYFAALDIQVDLLLGSSKKTERLAIQESCRNGSCQVLLGTHALLHEELKFKNLVLTITDEQHRFGVKQRADLGSSKADTLVPHRLYMTATPIPRSLAMIFFSDLEMSIMTDMPTGRKEVITEIIKEKDFTRVFDFMRSELKAGAQAYVIAPLIEESENLDLKSAEETYEHLTRDIFPDFRVGLLHGKMSVEEKDSIMKAFVQNALQILVSTTVVEVGVDNPRASIMLILGAERFGLAQLHQLRGRVGRGERQSYCFVESSELESTQERLKTLVRHKDGFALAEEDLRQRGPGDFFGTRQHGMPAFHLLNVYDDREIVRQVRELIGLLKLLPREQLKENQLLIQYALEERYPAWGQGITL